MRQTQIANRSAICAMALVMHDGKKGLLFSPLFWSRHRWCNAFSGQSGGPCTL